MANRSLPQITTYAFLCDRDYKDDFSELGVDDSSELEPYHIQLLIDRYCHEGSSNRKRGYLHNEYATPQEHFDFAYDMGVAMTMLGGKV